MRPKCGLLLFISTFLIIPHIESVIIVCNFSLSFTVHLDDFKDRCDNLKTSIENIDNKLKDMEKNLKDRKNTELMIKVADGQEDFKNLNAKLIGIEENFKELQENSEKASMRLENNLNETLKNFEKFRETQDKNLDLANERITALQASLNEIVKTLKNVRPVKQFDDCPKRFL
uniref:CSON008188 protein n=1 Tax=Culicoides sonorensis TaxID=179676 RepID=A0A336MZF4_CULSO